MSDRAFGADIFVREEASDRTSIPSLGASYQF